MAKTDQGEMENEGVIENVTNFLKDGCACALRTTGGLCSEQFSEAVVLFNLYNHWELSNG